ncbi:MAG: DNA-processing protein DprA [Clostridia bacterium]|nr:DNA-processing protein DprA [Clostridia bacterium]
MVYWVWLQQALGYGNKAGKLILNRFKNAETVFNLSEKEIISCGFLNKKYIEKLSNKNLKEAQNIVLNCKKHGIEIIPFDSEYYPKLLTEIENPPILLFVKGNKEILLNEIKISVVGPRQVSVFGKKAAFSLSARLALAGFTIVSGGALGCDTAAHKGALAVNGNTICVLGCGINAEYLLENKEFRNTISQKGLLISEYPPNFKASKFTFPVRNRIISGLSLGIVVIEANIKSGSLITANIAAEQGRDVFAIPGNINEPQYKGVNMLIRDGAKPLLELNDIIFEYLPKFPHKINPENAYSKKIILKEENNNVKKPKEEKIIKKNIKENLSNNAKIVYNYLDKPIFYLDDILINDLSDSQILASLTELEIYGYIKALPGGKYGLLN